MELKKIQDYYDQLFELYPNIPQRDIKRIMQYGLKAFLQHNNQGGDVLIHSNNIWLYCGKLMKDSLKYYEYYRRKMITKIRINHKKLKIPWDGYYYFGLTRNLYNKYLDLKNKKGRPKKYFTFDTVVFYKYFDECNLRNSGGVAIFRIPLYGDFGLSMYKENYITDKAELILERDPLTFHDILTSNYDYLYVTDYTKWKKKKQNGKCNSKSD